MAGNSYSDLRQMAREVVNSATSSKDPRYFSRMKMVVKAVNGNRIDVGGGTDELPMEFKGVPITTACSGVKAGDVVVVDVCNHEPIAMAVMLR